MAEEKRFYWLKLKSDFFKRHDIRIIESMPDGKEYVLFYLKLLCESVDHDGSLRFNDEIPYTEEMLSTITNTDIKIVKAALKTFGSLKLVQVEEDGTFYMTKVLKMTGSAVNNDNANRQRRFRENNKNNDNVTDSVTKNNADVTPDVTKNNESKSKRESKRKESEIEQESEIDSEQEQENNKTYQLIVDMYNDTCVSFPRLTALSQARKKAIKARLKIYTVEDFQTLFLKAETSRFLKGENSKDWSATFDWLIKDANMAKVLDGNYDDRINKNKTAQRLDDLKDMSFAWAERGDDPE